MVTWQDSPRDSDSEGSISITTVECDLVHVGSFCHVTSGA